MLLTDREAHHAQHVLRLRRGERITVLDGAGQEYLCEVQQCERHRISLGLIERRLQPAPASRITLLQAVPKGKTMEAIIQKAAELGASRIVPLLSERVVPQLEEKTGSHKLEKWRLAAIEAIKQCGSAWLPEIEAPLTPSQSLARGEALEMSLIASLQVGSRPARDHFRAFHTRFGRMPHSVGVWIGPEGDFSPAETSLIEEHGALPITLGQLVLRTETAAIYCLSVISHELLSSVSANSVPSSP